MVAMVILPTIGIEGEGVGEGALEERVTMWHGGRLTESLSPPELPLSWRADSREPNMKMVSRSWGQVGRLEEK